MKRVMSSFVSTCSQLSGCERVISLKDSVLLICDAGIVVLLGWHFVSRKDIKEKSHKHNPTGCSPGPSVTSATALPCLGSVSPPGLCRVVGTSGIPGDLEAAMQNPQRSGGEAAPRPVCLSQTQGGPAGPRPVLTGLDGAVLILEQTHWSGIFPEPRGGKQRGLQDLLTSSCLN